MAVAGHGSECLDHNSATLLLTDCPAGPVCYPSYAQLFIHQLLVFPFVCCFMLFSFFFFLFCYYTFLSSVGVYPAIVLTHKTVSYGCSDTSASTTHKKKQQSVTTDVLVSDNPSSKSAPACEAKHPATSDCSSSHEDELPERQGCVPLLLPPSICRHTVYPYCCTTPMNSSPSTVSTVTSIEDVQRDFCYSSSVSKGGGRTENNNGGSASSMSGVISDALSNCRSLLSGFCPQSSLLALNFIQGCLIILQPKLFSSSSYIPDTLRCQDFHIPADDGDRLLISYYPSTSACTSSSSSFPSSPKHSMPPHDNSPPPSVGRLQSSETNTKQCEYCKGAVLIVGGAGGSIRDPHVQSLIRLVPDYCCYFMAARGVSSPITVTPQNWADCKDLVSALNHIIHTHGAVANPFWNDHMAGRSGEPVSTRDGDTGTDESLPAEERSHCEGHGGGIFLVGYSIGACNVVKSLDRVGVFINSRRTQENRDDHREETGGRSVQVGTGDRERRESLSQVEGRVARDRRMSRGCRVWNCERVNEESGAESSSAENMFGMRRRFDIELSEWRESRSVERLSEVLKYVRGAVSISNPLDVSKYGVLP
eukprot:GHVQ01022804.1.p1 GENE.GHVQ01022804.1~~GHVQ01022804.1.p1  ORF type:complete len:592 (+),score=91.62 GHVQ01022804.1:164-1939(+)